VRFVGVRFDKLALRKKLRNLHTKSQLSSFCSFRDFSVHPDGQTEGQTDMARIYILYGETLPSTSYILSDESSKLFYSTSNGYNKVNTIGKHDMQKISYVNNLNFSC